LLILIVGDVVGLRRDVVDRGRVFVGLCREIVELDRRIVLEIVHGVDATAGAFLDWSARLVFLLRRLLATQPFRWRRRAEVRASIPASWAGRWAAEAAATGTWTAEAAATGAWATEAAATGTRAAEAAASGAWAAEATAASGSRREAAPTRWPWWTIFTCTRFADGERTSLERL
jgi:hypothetical protein